MICTWHGKPSDQFAPGTESRPDALDVYLHVPPFHKTHVLLHRMMGRQDMMVTAVICIDRPLMSNLKNSLKRLPAIQGQNLALTVFYESCSLDRMRVAGRKDFWNWHIQA